jgi:hypothetical protein
MVRGPVQLTVALGGCLAGKGWGGQGEVRGGGSVALKLQMARQWEHLQAAPACVGKRGQGVGGRAAELQPSLRSPTVVLDELLCRSPSDIFYDSVAQGMDPGQGLTASGVGSRAGHALRGMHQSGPNMPSNNGVVSVF